MASQVDLIVGEAVVEASNVLVKDEARHRDGRGKRKRNGAAGQAELEVKNGLWAFAVGLRVAALTYDHAWITTMCANVC